MLGLQQLQQATARIASDVAVARTHGAARVAKGALPADVVVGSKPWNDLRHAAYLQAGQGLAAVRNADALAAAPVGVPALTDRGTLPIGLWQARAGELATRFATDPHRERLLDGLRELAPRLREFDVEHVVLGGSFTTSKAVPHDIDGALVTTAPLSAQRRADLANLLAKTPRVRNGTLQLFLADDVVEDAHRYNRAGGGNSHHEGESMLEFFGVARGGMRRGLVASRLDDL